MKAQIHLGGATRTAVSGPEAYHWQVRFSARLGDDLECAGSVGVTGLDEHSDARIAVVVLPNDLPDWLPPEELGERVHWFGVQQLAPTLREPSEPPLSVDDLVIEEFEVAEGQWEYLGMR